LSPGSRDADAAQGGGPLLTVREVAARLRLSTATVYKLCRSGALRHVRISNAVRVPMGELELYIAGSRR
jgi:excisionase family DNA binding protein